MKSTLYDVMLAYAEKHPNISFCSSSFTHGQGASAITSGGVKDEIVDQINKEVFSLMADKWFSISPRGASNYELKRITVTDGKMELSIGFTIDTKDLYYHHSQYPLFEIFDINSSTFTLQIENDWLYNEKKLSQDDVDEINEYLYMNNSVSILISISNDGDRSGGVAFVGVLDDDELEKDLGKERSKITQYFMPRLQEQIDAIAWETLVNARDDISPNHDSTESDINLELSLDLYGEDEVEDAYIRGHFSEKYADEHCKRLFNVESKISI